MTKETQIEIFRRMIETTEEERAAMITSGMFNSFIEGYMIATLQELGYSKEEIEKAAACLYYDIFDTMTATEAKEKAIH